MPHAWIAAPLLLILVLALSAGTKIGRAEQTLEAMVSLRLPELFRQAWVAAVVPWAELVLACGLLVAPGRFALVFAALAVGLFVIYWLIVAVALRAHEPADCGCFGEVGAKRVNRWTLVRNTLLVGLAIVTFCGTARAGVVPTLVSLGSDAWWLAAVACGCALSWLIFARTGEIQTNDGPASEESADYLRAPIPFASLVTQDGTVVTLRELAGTKARLLLFLSGTCAPCGEMAVSVPEWKRGMPEIGVHAVFAADSDQLRQIAPEVLADAYYEDSTKASRVLGLSGKPAAVLLGADGLLAGGPVAGSNAVIEFVEQIKAQLEEARV